MTLSSTLCSCWPLASSSSVYELVRCIGSSYSPRAAARLGCSSEIVKTSGAERRSPRPKCMGANSYCLRASAAKLRADERGRQIQALTKPLLSFGMAHERRPSFSGMAGPRPKSRGWRPLSRSMVRASSPAVKSGDQAALAALRLPPAQRTVEEHAAVRRWSERSVRLPGGTTHEELSTVMTLEEHPPHSLLFRQGTPGAAPSFEELPQGHRRATQGHARPRTLAPVGRQKPPATQDRPTALHRACQRRRAVASYVTATRGGTVTAFTRG